MSLKNIADFQYFVIVSAVSAFLVACGSSRSTGRNSESSPYSPPRAIGHLRSAEIDEASGLAASRCQQDVIWTHNDSGDSARIFAIRSTGEGIATVAVEDAVNKDWEDIAATKEADGRCYVYVADIGNNALSREDLVIYRMPEPNLTDVVSTDQAVRAQALRFRYPDERQNAETLIVDAGSRRIYIVTKRSAGPAGVYALAPTFDSDTIQTATKVGDVALPSIPVGLVTGGDMSPDGQHVILCDYTAGFEWSLGSGEKIENALKRAPQEVDIGRRDTGEAIAYTAKGDSLLSTSEGSGAPIYLMQRK
jgi:hypothetical protein